MISNRLSHIFPLSRARALSLLRSLSARVLVSFVAQVQTRERARVRVRVYVYARDSALQTHTCCSRICSISLSLLVVSVLLACKSLYPSPCNSTCVCAFMCIPAARDKKQTLNKNLKSSLSPSLFTSLLPPSFPSPHPLLHSFSLSLSLSLFCSRPLSYTYTYTFKLLCARFLSLTLPVRMTLL